MGFGIVESKRQVIVNRLFTESNENLCIFQQDISEVGFFFHKTKSIKSQWFSKLSSLWQAFSTYGCRKSEVACQVQEISWHRLVHFSTDHVQGNSMADCVRCLEKESTCCGVCTQKLASHNTAWRGVAMHVVVVKQASTVVEKVEGSSSVGQ